MNRFNHTLISILAATTLASQFGCGGGDGNFIENPEFTQGTFQDDAQFKDFCAVPRTGTDMNGEAFPDKAGNVLNENNWLRSWSNDTYLWYSEIIDQDPALFTTPQDYFAVLKTEELTLSGTPKDNFHFLQDTATYQQSIQAGVSFGYGVRFVSLSNSPPRKRLIAYVENNSPASATDVNLARGAEILEVDGVDFVNATQQAEIDILNAGFRPSSEGESHSFTILDSGSTQPRTITMAATNVTSDPVLETRTIPTASGNVGYLLFNAFNTVAEERLFETMNQLASDNISDLVLDLRYNGGGFLYIASQLSYMIAGGNATGGKVFEETQFNDKYPTTNPINGNPLTPTPFINTTTSFGGLQAGLTLPQLNLNRVYILSTPSTCSASEAVINGLRGIDIEIILIGDTTCGKPYGFFATDNCGTTYFTIQFQGVNAKGFGDYADGFSPENTSANTPGITVPGCSVADDFGHPLGDSQEALLQAALNYRGTGTCPTPSRNKTQQLTPLQTKREFKLDEPFHLKNRILGTPKRH